MRGSTPAGRSSNRGEPWFLNLNEKKKTKKTTLSSHKKNGILFDLKPIWHVQHDIFRATDYVHF